MPATTRGKGRAPEAVDVDMADSQAVLALPSPHVEEVTTCTPPTDLALGPCPPTPSELVATTKELQPLGAPPTLDFTSLVEGLPGAVNIENMALHVN